MDTILLQLHCLMAFNLIISSCRVLAVNLTIEGDDIIYRRDNGGFILWGYIPCCVIYTSLGWLWHIWACMVGEVLGGPICLFQLCSTYTAACLSHTAFYHLYQEAGGWLLACWAHAWHVWCRDEFLFFLLCSFFITYMAR